MPIFIALKIADERLERIAELFKDLDFNVVPVELQHLTLLFIGDYSGKFLEKIVKLLLDVEVTLPDILKPTGISLLPPSKGTHIVIEVLDEDNLLYKARKVLEKKLSKHIELRDRYEFKPHITIARRLKPLNNKAYTRVTHILQNASKMLPRFIVVHDLYLYETSRNGTYIPLTRIKVKWTKI